MGMLNTIWKMQRCQCFRVLLTPCTRFGTIWVTIVQYYGHSSTFFRTFRYSMIPWQFHILSTSRPQHCTHICIQNIYNINCKTDTKFSSFSPLWFESRSGHMWESRVLLTDGQVVFPRVRRFSPTFDERSARYKWNILERDIKPKSKRKKNHQNTHTHIHTHIYSGIKKSWCGDWQYSHLVSSVG